MELSDKLKNEIVENQIKEIKEDGNNAINYEKLQMYLEKGISNVFQILSNDLDNIEDLYAPIDRNLLKDLENPSSGSATRLYHRTRGAGINTNKELLEAYQSKGNELLKLRGIGKKPFDLAGKYLIKKGFIKE